MPDDNGLNGNGGEVPEVPELPDDGILTMAEARDAVRVDGTANDVIIYPLLQAIPGYLKTTTGKDWLNDTNPLAKVVAKFILQLWYYPQTEDAARLQRTIDTLLLTLSAEARGR